MYEINVNINLKQHSDIWESIVTQWIKNNQKYLEENDFYDSTYWHNEMANVSCLVGAIWKVGGVAIAEYTTTKSDVENNNRTDLYFSIGGVKYLVEAKYLRDAVTKENIENKMKEAVSDCCSIRNQDIENKMALVFVSPTDDNCLPDLENCDIKVLLKINGKTDLNYAKQSYNRIYLFGKYVE